MKNIYLIEEYFTDKEIIKILCKKRSLAAKKSHDGHFLRNISEDAKSPHKAVSKKIYQYFPPRSEWIRLNKEERSKRNTNAIEVNAIQLERTIWSQRKKLEKSCNPIPTWLKNLNELIIDIQQSVLKTDSKYIIPKPFTIPVLKDKAKKEYRPISSFDLKDLIIIGQISKYLTNCFDPLFLDCSYAFRSRRNGEKILNHHEAIRDIIAYNKKRVRSIYVSECDIKKFYDCVNHSIINKRFAEFLVKAKSTLGLNIDYRAVRLFFSYLNCFSFNNDINKKQNELLNQIGIKEGSIPWVTRNELFEVDSNPDYDRIGVPQGGALSCLIANLILDSVDRKIISLNIDDILYVRFCDDMVLMHPQKDVCKKVFQIYQNALREVKLINHNPISIESYSNEFWGEKMKSKAPYKWDIFEKDIDERKSNVPWLSFVGYQVRYDNLLRIRKKSIEKELKKQVSETDKIINVIKKSKKASINKKAIVFRLQQRLISMAVGRVQADLKSPKMCWSAGFNVVKENKNIKAQFTKLDKNRERQIIRMNHFVNSISAPITKSKRKIKQLKFYGFRYSYYKQFLY
jgi:hypothetical protein